MVLGAHLIADTVTPDSLFDFSNCLFQFKTVIWLVLFFEWTLVDAFVFKHTLSMSPVLFSKQVSVNLLWLNTTPCKFIQHRATLECSVWFISYRQLIKSSFFALTYFKMTPFHLLDCKIELLTVYTTTNLDHIRRELLWIWRYPRVS